jgi:thiamine-phosphate pyrophosphorylase
MTARLYLITPAAFDPAAFAEMLKAALDAAPVACVRLTMDGAEAAIRRAADTLQPVCAAADVALTITDHVRLVEAHGLDGVHLTDASPAAIRKARAALGDDRIVGACGGATRHRAMTAAEAGTDYVSLGPVSAGALGDGTEADDDLFAWWAEMIETPSVAEGGLTLEAGRRLAPLADFLAPRRSVWDAPDGPAAAVRAYAAILAAA